MILVLELAQAPRAHPLMGEVHLEAGCPGQQFFPTWDHYAFQTRMQSREGNQSCHHGRSQCWHVGEWLVVSLGRPSCQALSLQPVLPAGLDFFRISAVSCPNSPE